MKVQEIMERAGIKQTGRAIAYIKDALAEINMLAETHIRRERMDITEDKRFYQIPNEAVKVIDIRCKNHLNNEDIYKSIPRMVYEPDITDADGE
tara:strand:+ start:213 stop:494 length:282 start_codon:yes stop_codon:yes gene_type:complete